MPLNDNVPPKTPEDLPRKLNPAVMKLNTSDDDDLTVALRNASQAMSSLSDTFSYHISGSNTSGPVYVGGAPLNNNVIPFPNTGTAVQPFNGPQPLHGWDLDIQTGTRVPTPCEASGHVFTRDEEAVEYMDGVIVLYCDACGCRLQMRGIPGALSFKRVKWLIGDAMSLDAGDQDVDLSELLGELVNLEQALDKDQEAIDLAKRLLIIARKVAEKHAV